MFQTLALLLSTHPSPFRRLYSDPQPFLFLGGLCCLCFKAGQVSSALLPGEKDLLSPTNADGTSSLPKELSGIWSCPPHRSTHMPFSLLCDMILQRSSATPTFIAKADLPQALKVLCKTFPITGPEVIFYWFPIQHRRRARGRLWKACERQLNEYTVPSNCDSIIFSHYSNRNKSFSSQPYYLTQRKMVCNPVRAGLLLDTF